MMQYAQGTNQTSVKPDSCLLKMYELFIRGNKNVRVPLLYLQGLSLLPIKTNQKPMLKTKARRGNEFNKDYDTVIYSMRKVPVVFLEKRYQA